MLKGAPPANTCTNGIYVSQLQMRELAPHVPVFFVSGYNAGDRDVPLDDRTVFVPKPYSIDILCNAIDSLLAS